MNPNNFTSVLLARDVANQKVDVGFYIPDGAHEQVMPTIVDDVMLDCSTLDIEVWRLRAGDDLSNFNFIFFPFLNVKPDKPTEKFSMLCRNLFRLELHILRALPKS